MPLKFHILSIKLYASSFWTRLKAKKILFLFTSSFHLIFIRFNPYTCTWLRLNIWVRWSLGLSLPSKQANLPKLKSTKDKSEMNLKDYPNSKESRWVSSICSIWPRYKCLLRVAQYTIQVASRNTIIHPQNLFNPPLFDPLDVHVKISTETKKKHRGTGMKWRCCYVIHVQSFRNILILDEGYESFQGTMEKRESNIFMPEQKCAGWLGRV